MKRRDTTLAEDVEALQRALRDLWLAILHSLGLHTAWELQKAKAMATAHRDRAEVARAHQREAERLLVLLSEPLKDWDLADFPRGEDDPEAQRHLNLVIQAYRLTAPAVAPLRMNRVTSDQAHRRGWGDQPLHPAVAQRLARDPKRLP